jgi:hypothetical protein
MNNLYNYLRDNYRAYLLTLGEARDTPGLLLETAWQWKSPWAPPKPEFTGEIGFAWDIINMDPLVAVKDYPTVLIDAAMVIDNVTDAFEVNGSVDLPQFGLSTADSISRGMSVNLSISAVKASVFLNPAVSDSLVLQLRSIRASDPERWNRQINKAFLITQSYYVSNLTAEFHTAGTESAKAAFERAGLTVGGSFSLDWNNDHIFTLSGTGTVPFAVRGERIDAA